MTIVVLFSGVSVASGLLIVNPPRSAIAPLTSALDYLKDVLATPGTSKCDWLVPERS